MCASRRTILRRVLIPVAVVMVVAGCVGYWALDEYVIDHVVIDDVAAYEAAVRSATTEPAATSSTLAHVIAAATTIASIPGTTAPTISDSSYSSDSMSIEISTVVRGEGDATLTYFVADVVVDDATRLRSGFAENKFGENIIADTSEIAEYYGAVFAINGDYYGFRSSGIVIRNGVVFRDVGARTGLAMYVDGSMAVYDETTTTAEDLLASGVWNTLSFGPALLVDGQVVAGIEDVELDTNFGNHSIQGNQPRTGIGVIDANHFLFVVVDGRSPGYSRGVAMTEFARIFQDLGATLAYNLDGGGSATMWFNGELVNDPLGKGTERGTSDILYLA